MLDPGRCHDPGPCTFLLLLLFFFPVELSALCVVQSFIALLEENYLRTRKAACAFFLGYEKLYIFISQDYKE